PTVNGGERGGGPGRCSEAEQPRAPAAGGRGLTMAGPGSRYMMEPFECGLEHRFEATERIMALQFGTVEKRLERIEAMIGGVERRLWMTVFGVCGVILAQAVQGLVEFGPR